MDPNGSPGQNPPSGKGKGKVDGSGSTTAAEADGNRDSSSSLTAFSERLTNSAAHLARSFLAGQPENDDLARLASSTSKSTPAETKPAIAGESSRQAASFASLSAFRPTQAEEHAAREETAFSNFLDQTSAFEPSAVAPAEQGGQLESLWAASAGHGQANGGHPRSTVTHGNHEDGPSIRLQEARDGAEVVALLSDHEAEMGADGDVPLSESDAAALRRALFDNNAHLGSGLSLEWDNALNFIPDFMRPDGEGGGDARTANMVKSADSTSVLGLPHGPDAEKQWLDHWQDVLTRYDDEVWGDLGPLVRKARDEVRKLEQVGTSEAAAETKALQRLQQLLGHIRGP